MKSQFGSAASTVEETPTQLEAIGKAIKGTQFKLSALNAAPASAVAAGEAFEIRFAADGIYLCIATNTWVKVALATWA